MFSKFNETLLAAIGRQNVHALSDCVHVGDSAD